MSILTGKIKDFLRYHQNRSLSKPNTALGLCVMASNNFAYILPHSKVIHLLGNRRPFAKRIDGYPSIDPEYYHAIVLFNSLTIDWTRRQLDPRCPFPFIQPLKATKRDWIKIANTAQELGL